MKRHLQWSAAWRIVACALLALILHACHDAESGSASSAASTAWLHTRGNRIYTADGRVWAGRGANVHDTRSCDTCTWSAPDVAEVNRRVDELVDHWHADFLRLALESYPAAGGRTQWKSLEDDPGYLRDILAIVRHIGTKPGVVVLVSLWSDPSFDDKGWPTDATVATWRTLAAALRDEGHVMFGVANEPKLNADGALDAQVWARMNAVVDGIRQVEAQSGGHRHIIAVQGTRSWARSLDYYLSHPITAGGGADIVYETHVYDPKERFPSLLGADPPLISAYYGLMPPA